MNGTTSARSWLAANVVQYTQVDCSISVAIYDFVMIWSLLENRLVRKWNDAQDDQSLNQTLNPKVIKGMAGEFKESDTHTAIAEVFSYFVNRYVETSNASMYALKFKNLVDEDMVEEVLLEESPTELERLTAVLLIVNRLRNNFLHGEKWNSGLGDQKDNFVHSTAAMIACLNELPEAAEQ